MSKKEFKPSLAFNEIIPKIKGTEKAFEKLCNVFDVLAKNEDG